MTQIIGVLRENTAGAQITGIAPKLSLDAKGALYAHIVSGAGGASLPVGDFIPLTVTVAVTSTEILAADTARTYFAVYNLGANTVFLNFGAAATLLTFPLLPGAFYEPLVVPTNQITGIVAASTENVFVTSV